MLKELPYSASPQVFETMIILGRILFYCGLFCLTNHVISATPVPSKSLKLLQELGQENVDFQSATVNHSQIQLKPFFLKWEKEEGFPKVILTPKQLSWFNSLGSLSEDHKAPPKATRKEIRHLSEDEWQTFISAMWKMQTSFPDPNEEISEYGIFVKMHRFDNAPAAHGGAAFLPWHREYLWRFEQALRSHEPGVSLVYWDSTLDQPLPDPTDSIVWSDNLLGINTDFVTTGPFANWSIIPECHYLHGNPLRRRARPGSDSNRLLLYNDEILEFFWNLTEYRELCGPEYNSFEGAHGGAHGFVSGHMGQLTCSPSDPFFWMHHGFVDFIWEQFRQNSQLTDAELEYPTGNDQDIGGQLHEAYSYMEPFKPLYNIHGLSNHYTNYYFTYDPRPVHCKADEECGSSYLWCNKARGRCTSKIKTGGKCDNLPDEACFGSVAECIDGRCL